MRLTKHTDYALRTLIYLAALKSETRARTAEIAKAYEISNHHLVKVVHELGQAGFIHTIPGRGGGITLAREPGAISVGEVVRALEPNLAIVECFMAGGGCMIASACRLKGVLAQARDAFMTVLDGVTIADVSGNRSALATLLG